MRIEPVEEEYRIGTQDLIEVQVLGVQDLRREARVNAKGLIGLPLIGAVRVQGLTAAEAEALIAGLYSKNYLQNPEVSVFVKEFTRQNVTIDGAVAKPGIYPLKGPTTLMQALANAGGQGSLSDLADVVLFRMEDSERRALKFDVTKIRAAEAPDPLLQPGDLIVVNRSRSARCDTGLVPRRPHRDLQPVQLHNKAVASPRCRKKAAAPTRRACRHRPPRRRSSSVAIPSSRRCCSRPRSLPRPRTTRSTFATSGTSSSSGSGRSSRSS